MSDAPVEPRPVKVSVAMITYNHERYVAQAIESVLMQETDFPVELVIGEDCSTDATRAIVVNYAERYPDVIRPLLSERNLGMMPNFVATLGACTGKYIAICEGDDYWTDPHKLQKQVDFLEAHLECSMCFHPIYRLVDTINEIHVMRPRGLRFLKRSYTLNDIARTNFVPTASVLFRNGLVAELPTWYYDAPVGDWALFVLLAQHGKIGLIDQAMAVWRVHDKGMWSGADASARHRMVFGMLETLRAHLGPQYEKQIKAGVSDHWLSMAVNSADRGDSTNARAYLLKSISGCPFNPDMQILDKSVLLARLYTPSVYEALKRLQAGLSSSLKP